MLPLNIHSARFLQSETENKENVITERQIVAECQYPLKVDLSSVLELIVSVDPYFLNFSLKKERNASLL